MPSFHCSKICTLSNGRHLSLVQIHLKDHEYSGYLCLLIVQGTSLLRSSITSLLWTNTDLGAGSVGMQMVALGCSEASGKTEGPGIPALASQAQQKWVHSVANFIFQPTLPNTFKQSQTQLTIFMRWYLLWVCWWPDREQDECHPCPHSADVLVGGTGRGEEAPPQGHVRTKGQSPEKRWGVGTGTRPLAMGRPVFRAEARGLATVDRAQ